MMRVIHLPAVHLRVSLGAYVNAVRTAIRNPDAEFKHGLTTWWPTTGREIQRQFIRGLHERISEAIPYSKRGTNA